MPAGSAFGNWWSLMRPYYTKAYQEMWVGIGIMTVLYYKVSYGAASLNKVCSKRLTELSLFISVRDLFINTPKWFGYPIFFYSEPKLSLIN
uniref:ATP synthase membrane subunit j n=1 Tax=Kryptolebias marmoratus TaxID=37003 RepID=A0A3Q3BSP7_KRYMA